MGDKTYEEKVGDTPWFEVGKPPEDKRKAACGACGSDNTVCVHYDAGGCIIGWSIEEEYKCLDCGRYTALIEEYES